MSLRFRLIFASACALLALLLGLSFADRVRADAEQQRNDAIARYGGEVVSVVVTSGHLEAGDVIEPQDVQLRDWIAELVPEGAVTSLDDVVGRQLCHATAKNEVLTSECFDEGDGMAEVPAGFVGVTLPVTDKLGIFRSVTPGTKLIAYEVNKDSSRQIGDDIVVISSPAAAGAASGAQVAVAIRAADVDKVLSANAAGKLSFVAPASDVRSQDVGSATGDGDQSGSASGQGGETGARDGAPEEVKDGERPATAVGADGAGDSGARTSAA
ncbi:SAF domain-containing protein [Olsenella massiliensis]|uniref:SAF domain-containing protein n=1 Tax=Olsenella massiliensis TaxID=1622075 RepID=UPI0009E90715|nr:SAF domain-containing protein [Olsenella massiliensis]